ncbi:hypothetical protein E4U21_002184 [Claviceps maximensis]|nr:hypothetical protein E4U21_002184 [Claviceps maximensis]
MVAGCGMKDPRQEKSIGVGKSGPDDGVYAAMIACMVDVPFCSSSPSQVITTEQCGKSSPHEGT